MFCYIIIFWKSFDEIGFTYKIPANLEKNLKPGQIVKIPFWNKEEFWLVYEIFSKIPDILKNSVKICRFTAFTNYLLTEIINYGNNLKDIYELKFKAQYLLETVLGKIEKIKEINEILDEKQYLTWYRIELLKFISKHYFTPIHNSLSLFLPKNLTEKVKKQKLDYKYKEISYLNAKNVDLTENQQKIFDEIIKSRENKFLLFWVTWSWKTEIYIKLIEKYFES